MKVRNDRFKGYRQARDRLKFGIAAGTIQLESLPGPDAWQELYAKQIGQGEDVGRLAMRIGIESGGMNFTERILEYVEDVGRLVYSTPDEAAEQGNVIVRDVPIGDSARPAVAKMSGVSDFLCLSHTLDQEAQYGDQERDFG